jgi:hypothetical protein
LLYLRDCRSIDDAALFKLVQLDFWRNLDGTSFRIYAHTEPPDAQHWETLELINDLQGSSTGLTAKFHYVVETDVAKENEVELNQWYDTEHLRGLAQVAGTVRARRFRRTQGSPKYLACYDLTSAEAIHSNSWLRVRSTPWSSRVRPNFQNARRTMYTRLELGAT